jgi:hypothetical protein
MAIENENPGAGREPAAPAANASPEALMQTWLQLFGNPGLNWFNTDAMPFGSPLDLSKAFAQNPVLASIDKIWNANPLREVIPIDWGGIASALRVVSIRSLANPARALSITMNFRAFSG